MVLDEVITDLPTLVRAVAADAMDHINLKIGRVGGLTKARLMRDAAVELGLKLTIEDSWGGDLVTAAVSHLAAATPPGALFAVSYMNDWTVEHIAGYQPRSAAASGRCRKGPAWASRSTPRCWAPRCSRRAADGEASSRSDRRPVKTASTVILRS